MSLTLMDVAVMAVTDHSRKTFLKDTAVPPSDSIRLHNEIQNKNISLTILTRMWFNV